MTIRSMPNNMSGLPYMNLDELAALFGYKNAHSVWRAINRGTLEVPTYKIRGHTVADVEVVKAFFAKERERGLKEIAARD